jgi:hypothetical protein
MDNVQKDILLFISEIVSLKRKLYWTQNMFFFMFVRNNVCSDKRADLVRLKVRADNSFIYTQIFSGAETDGAVLIGA